MSVWNNCETLGGLPVFDLFAETEDDATSAALPDAASVAWRLAVHFDCETTFAELADRFFAQVDTSQVSALAIGYWGTDILEEHSPAEVIDQLCTRADRLPRLRHLFFGDITSEEHEISWIPPADITPLLETFTDLHELTYRFGQNNSATVTLPALRPLRHAHLRTLRLQTGGMPAHVPGAVAACDLPALEELELWLGVTQYGGDVSVDQVRQLVEVLNDSDRFPNLRRLGLMNSEVQDEIAALVAAAPVVARLHELDLSMGTLGDEGAEALLGGQPLGHLRRLVLRHHFVTEPMRDRLTAAVAAGATPGTPGTVVDLGDACTPWPDARDPREGRYTDVAE